MLERHEAQDDPNAIGRDSAREAAPVTDRPIADREVPLPGTAAADASASVINQWLDGEVSEADARRADAQSVDFWKRLDGDADRMRRAKPPAHLAANIMAAIPVREPGTAAKSAPIIADMEPRRDA